MKPSNDNQAPDPREAAIGKLLANSAVRDEQMKGLLILLETRNVPRDTVQEAKGFLSDINAASERADIRMIESIRTLPPPREADVFDKVLSRLESYASEFDRTATTEDQVKLAAGFRQLVEGMGRAWSEPEQDRNGPDMEM